MNTDLLQATIEIVFSGHMLYVIPFLLLMMAILLSDRIISFIKAILQDKRTRY